MLFSSELKGIVDQCHVEDLILVPAGHYWTRESGLVDYYQPEWDCDGFSDKFTDPLNQNYTNGHTNGHHTNGNTNGNVEDHETNNDNAIKKKPAFKTEEDCKAALEKAVIRRCMADVEIGLLLSGGLDSSILGAIMMQPHIKKHLTGLLLFFRKISGLCMMKFSFYLLFFTPNSYWKTQVICGWTRGLSRHLGCQSCGCQARY